MPHVFASNVGVLAAAEMALNEIGRFLRSCLGISASHLREKS
jgi:hypothetical protein